MKRQEFLDTLENADYSDEPGYLNGRGNLQDDLLNAEQNKGKECIEVIRGGDPALTSTPYMLLLVFDDGYVVTGYDGNEYCHNFEFPK